VTKSPAAVADHARQSPYSDPASWASLFDEVEPTIEAVSGMSRNVVAHYRAQESELPESSRDDIGLRWIDAILQTDQARHPVGLTVERALGERVQGCCRDHSLLAVAALRHHGVPARSRVGFARYLSPIWNADHVIVEAWLGGRWKRFDPEFAGGPVALPLLSDPADIAAGPDSPFPTAAQVWAGHRAGTIDVSRYGVAEGLGIGGDWFVHSYVIAELAHRFGDELLLWDTWGAMCRDLDHAPPADILLVDEVAALLIAADEGDIGAEGTLLQRYRTDPRLHPGSSVRSVSPYGGVSDINLSRRTVAPAG